MRHSWPVVTLVHSCAASDAPAGLNCAECRILDPSTGRDRAYFLHPEQLRSADCRHRGVLRRPPTQTSVRYNGGMVGCRLVRSFPLACELAEHVALRGAPVAVADPGGALLAVSAAAEAQGVRTGQTAREAVGRCPTLAVLDARPARYQAAWEAILAAIERVAYTFEPAGQG